MSRPTGFAAALRRIRFIILYVAYLAVFVVGINYIAHRRFVNRLKVIEQPSRELGRQGTISRELLSRVRSVVPHLTPNTTNPSGFLNRRVKKPAGVFRDC